nr:exocyst complex component EXO84B [Ipomoea batatas]
MVSELAGEGAMPLPKSASHAELSAKILSTELVAVVSSSQRRMREKKQLITPIRDFSSEKSQGERRVSDMKNRVGKLRSEIEIEAPTTNIEEAIKRKRFRGAVAEIDSWSRSMDTNLCSVFSKPESAISPVSEMSFSSTLSSRSAMVKVCVEEHNKSFIWIWLVLIAIACCENMVFVAILKQREAPNVMPTGRSPAIPIMVQWSAAKDRSLDYGNDQTKFGSVIQSGRPSHMMLEKNILPCAIFTVFCVGAVIGQAIAMDTRIPLMSFTGAQRSLLATLINNLAEGVHIDSLFDSLPDSATNSSSNDEISEPSDIENWLTEFPDHLDVLLAIDVLSSGWNLDRDDREQPVYGHVRCLILFSKVKVLIQRAKFVTECAGDGTGFVKARVLPYTPFLCFTLSWTYKVLHVPA